MNNENKSARSSKGCLTRFRSFIGIGAAMCVVCGMLLTTANIFAATPDTHLTFTHDVSVSLDHRQVRMIISATGADNQPIQGLSEKHFAVAVDGQQRQITKLSRAAANDQPLAVVLAIDVSGSMAGSAFRAAREAASSLINELHDGDEVAIITFGETAKKVLAFTQDKVKAKDALKQLEAGDNATLLYEGLLQSTEEASRATTSKAVVIAITDGKDEGSNVILDDVFAKAKSSSIAIYTLGFGPQEDRSTLKRISTVTGGEYRHTIKAGELSGLYQSILDDLRNAYALDVDVPKLEPGSHKVAVTVSYRSDTVTATTEARIPFPPLPWLLIAVVGLVVLVALLVILGLTLSRRRSATFVRRRPARSLIPIRASSARISVDVVEGPQHGRQVRVAGRRLRIGTAADCELRSDDGALAPLQAEIVREHGGLARLVNGQGKSPTLLNGNQLRPSESVTLRNGDQIKAGSLVMIFADQQQARSASA